MARELTQAEGTEVTRSPLLADLDADARASVLREMEARSWNPGDEVLAEGEPSGALYVILEGEARVSTRAAERDVELASLGRGAVFGEGGLLSGRARSATVTATTELRCAVLPGEAFMRHLEREPEVRRDLEALSTRRLRDRLVRSIAPLQGLDLTGTQQGDVSRVSFRAGERILEEGAASDAVYFVLDGVALAFQVDAKACRRLSRAGPGQCVGELGVLEEEPRSATVIAETDVEALRVEADRFRAWVEENPGLADFLGTLERVYPLASGKRLSVYRGEHEGRASVTTVAGDPSGDCVLSTKILGEDALVLARGAAELEGAQAELRFEDAEDGRVRELLLDQAERGTRDAVVRGRLAGVEVEGVGPDVSRLYHGLRDREVLDRRDLARFLRTGYLGGDAAPSDPDKVCHCLGIGRGEIAAAATEHGADAETVSEAVGVGVVCGSCLPTVRDLLAGGLEGRSRDETVGVRDAAGPTKPIPEVASPLVVRQPDIRFDMDALTRIAAEPEAHVAAVASVFAAVGERYMIRRVGEALSRVEDAALAADVERFIEQESRHVTTHEPLNRLLLERAYPWSGALRRASRRMVGGADQLSPRAGLALCAAFEHIADSAFGTFFTTYYAQHRRYSPDEAVHADVVRSGIGPLLHWHGGEELAHRHVAFDVMQAAGARWWQLWLGFGVLALQAVLLLIPALASLRVAPGAGRTSRARGTRGVSIVLGTIGRGLRFLRPGFHPRRESYPFLPEIEKDLERIPEA